MSIFQNMLLLETTLQLAWKSLKLSEINQNPLLRGSSGEEKQSAAFTTESN